MRVKDVYKTSFMVSFPFKEVLLSVRQGDYGNINKEGDGGSPYFGTTNGRQNHMKAGPSGDKNWTTVCSL